MRERWASMAMISCGRPPPGQKKERNLVPVIILALCCALNAAPTNSPVTIPETKDREIALKNGRFITGRIIGIVPAQVKIQTSTGTEQIPVRELAWGEKLGLPGIVSDPYLEIDRLYKKEDANVAKLAKDQAELKTAFSNILGVAREMNAKTTAEGITIKSCQVKELERSSGYVTCSWKVEMMNGSGTPQKRNAELVLSNKDGFKVKGVSVFDVNLLPGKLLTLSDTFLLKADLWDTIIFTECRLED